MNSYIADLDAALAENGEEAILRRSVGSRNTVHIDVCVVINTRTRVASRNSDEVIDGIGQANLNVTMSLTQIIAAQWPGGGVEVDQPFLIDRSIPKRGDTMIIKGRAYYIEIVDAIKIKGEIVRINVALRGETTGR